MACKDGECVAGVIGSKSILQKDWDQAVRDFEVVIEDFNVRGRKFQVNHPGFVHPAKFCMKCGRKIDG